MEGYDLFKIYLPTKLHFTTDYDILKYEKRTKSISYETYFKRKDCAEFDKWARIVKTKERAAGLCLANFSQSNDNWLYEGKDLAIEVYTSWKRTRSSITEIFKNDLNVLSSYSQGKDRKVSSWEGFVSKTGKGNKPPLLQLLGASKITRESVAIMDRCGASFISNWNQLYCDDPLLNDYTKRLLKYAPFCNKLCNEAQSIFDQFKESINSNV